MCRATDVRGVWPLDDAVNVLPAITAVVPPDVVGIGDEDEGEKRRRSTNRGSATMLGHITISHVFYIAGGCCCQPRFLGIYPEPSE